MIYSKEIVFLSILVSTLLLSGCGTGSSSYEEKDKVTQDEPAKDEPTQDETTLEVSNETYYKYLWHIDSKNCRRA